jgi:hypothetical protein
MHCAHDDLLQKKITSGRVSRHGVIFARSPGVRAQTGYCVYESTLSFEFGAVRLSLVYYGAAIAATAFECATVVTFATVIPSPNPTANYILSPTDAGRCPNFKKA